MADELEPLNLKSVIDVSGWKSELTKQATRIKDAIKASEKAKKSREGLAKVFDDLVKKKAVQDIPSAPRAFLAKQGLLKAKDDKEMLQNFSRASINLGEASIVDYNWWIVAQKEMDEVVEAIEKLSKELSVQIKGLES